MTLQLLAMSYVLPMLILALVAAVAATAVHARCGQLWLGSLVAAVLGTAVWFAVTAPLALADGWLGFAEEWPYLLRAILICTAFNFPIALAVGMLVRFGRLSRRAEHHYEV